MAGLLNSVINLLDRAFPKYAQIPRWQYSIIMIVCAYKIYNDRFASEFNPSESQNIIAIANGSMSLKESLVDMSPTAYQTLLQELHSDKGLGAYNSVIAKLIDLDRDSEGKHSHELINSALSGIHSLKAQKGQNLPIGWSSCPEFADAMSFILNQIGINNSEISGHLLSRDSIDSEITNHRFLGIIDKKGKFYILECASADINSLRESKITYEEFKKGKPVIFDHYKISYYGYGKDLARLKEELGKCPKVNLNELPSDKIQEILSLYKANNRYNSSPYIDSFGQSSNLDRIAPSPNIERIDKDTGQRVRRAQVVEDINPYR